MHPAQIVVCTSTLKCGLTPSTTQVIGASMKDGAMIYQDYGTGRPACRYTLEEYVGRMIGNQRTTYGRV